MSSWITKIRENVFLLMVSSTVVGIVIAILLTKLIIPAFPQIPMLKDFLSIGCIGAGLLILIGIQFSIMHGRKSKAL